jgi:hypothetical protein
LKIWGIWDGSFSAMCFIAKGFVALMGCAKATELVIGLAGDFFCR